MSAQLHPHPELKQVEEAGTEDLRIPNPLGRPRASVAQKAVSEGFPLLVLNLWISSCLKEYRARSEVNVDSSTARQIGPDVSGSVGEVSQAGGPRLERGLPAGLGQAEEARWEQHSTY